MTIDTTYFEGELSLGQITSGAVTAAVNLYIEKYEDLLLTRLLGYELYRDYKAGIAVVPTPLTKWTELRDGKEYTNSYDVLTKYRGLKFTSGSLKQSPIANFVYYHYLKDNISFTMGAGEVKPKSNSSDNVNPYPKMVRAWNEMVDWNWELVHFLREYDTIYPQFEDSNVFGFYPSQLDEVLRYKNRIGL